MTRNFIQVENYGFASFSLFNESLQRWWAFEVFEVRLTKVGRGEECCHSSRVWSRHDQRRKATSENNQLQKLTEYSVGNIEIIHLKRPTLLWSRFYVSLSLSSPCVVTDTACLCYTDKKENQIFLVYKEIQIGTVVKSYVTNGLLNHPHIWGNNCAFPHILGSPSSYMTLQLLHSEFPYIARGKIWFSFYQCMADGRGDGAK